MWAITLGATFGVEHLQTVERAIPEPAAELPNYGRPYASGVEVFGNGTLTIASSWADYLRLGMFVLRMNKLVAALAQVQRLARQAGWIQ